MQETIEANQVAVCNSCLHVNDADGIAAGECFACGQPLPTTPKAKELACSVKANTLEETRRWISTTERLPEAEEDSRYSVPVLVCSAKSGTVIRQYNHVADVWYDIVYTGSEPARWHTHWQPLPAAPGKEGGEAQ